MFHPKSFRPAAAAAAVLFGGGIWMASGQAKAVSSISPMPADLSAADVQPKDGHPKLESSLARLASMALAGEEAQAREYGHHRRLDIRGASVRVVTEAAAEPLANAALVSARTAVLKAKVAALGGRMETQWRHLLQHEIPLAALETLASDPLVKYVRPPRKPFKTVVYSEGVARTGADTWRNLTAYRTDETGLCVLDAGFMGYAALLGSELPSQVTTRSFRADRDLEADDHGAACAEIAYDMAPGAKFTLVNIDTDVEQHQAVDWIARQDIDVISYSLGWFNGGAGDGTGPICEDVETAAGANILWVSAAGNGATDHWDGFFSDPDADGWHNFAPQDEILDFTVPAYLPLGAFLNWKDFGAWNGVDYAGTDQDYDLYLYRWTGTAWQFVDSAASHQLGTGIWPVEEIFGWYATRDTVWGVAVYASRRTKNVRLEIFTYNNSSPIQYVVPGRSVVVPADSPSAIAVGATDWSNDAYHSYSSQGPTHGGLVKPDLTAPSGVSTATYGNRNFYGTSSSVPHVAGAAALLRGLTPFSPAQALKILQQRAVDLGDPGKDNIFGFGRLNLKR
ncbi:MAG: hypothetical protein FJY80_07635 [Candidatus Aminicenantes bacterium]|nr:hypothetical protein [Candidatus Aminicenantes bacterium]